MLDAFDLTPSYVPMSMPFQPMCWTSSGLKKNRMSAMYVGFATTGSSAIVFSPRDAVRPLDSTTSRKLPRARSPGQGGGAQPGARLRSPDETGAPVAPPLRTHASVADPRDATTRAASEYQSAQL